MKRKFIAILLILVHVFITFSSTVFAEGNPSVSAGNSRVKPGEETHVSVNITNNPGLVSFILYVECDTSVFSLDYDDENSSYKVINGPDFSSMLCNINGNNGWKVVWYGANEITADGILFTLPLKTNETAKAGKYPVEISYSAKNTLNSKYQEVKLDCINGYIDILPTEASFSINSIDCVPGSICNLSVNIDANPGLASYMIYVDCDTTLFSANYNEPLQSYDVELGDFSDGGTIVCNKNGNKGYQILWMNSVESLNTGPAFVLPLSVSNDADIKDYPFTLRVEEANICDEQGNVISAVVNSGVVSVKDFLFNVNDYNYSKENHTALIDFTLDNARSNGVVLYFAFYQSNGQLIKIDSLVLPAKSHKDTNKTFTNLNGQSQELKVIVVESKNYYPITAPFDILLADL